MNDISNLGFKQKYSLNPKLYDEQLECFTLKTRIDDLENSYNESLINNTFLILQKQIKQDLLRK
ncbi:hypothetical protein SS50377_22287 [Spironucleus salmonicida]|uniref:Uncharacterized protein n=1 Tax=Spironucleus salmonicida TaxID=348837 RepID=V6LNB7_9EUKA|nr:hypothetical protein SS50377_22287 [Spironucleus salmonicida]|eukprot:EST42219.1 Hypothetical protein SS50377_18521 [Spironucleus salmonicida]